MDGNFRDWIKNSSDEELSDKREEMRQVWLDNGQYDEEMNEIDNELAERYNERWREENPDPKPRYREHGWMLPNDEP